ncbi:hypothetical protein GGR56DRAFT_680926 [Xylariaceae sp. FL0804]|nr:hypothetical protein GGR56DRAFT_680926 [Xylariaceae sp. FL0804]
MASSSHNRKNVLKQPGFFVGPGDLFSSRGVAAKVYNAFLGAPGGTNVDLTLAKENVGNHMLRLIQGCLSHDVLYTAVRGGQVFWDTVAAEWDTEYEFEPAEVRELTEVFVDARVAYIGNQQTALTDAVDRWMVIADQVSQMDPATEVQLALRPTQIGALGSALQSMQINQTWPPAHFNAQEFAWITDGRFRQYLANIQTSEPLAVTRTPIPSERSSPVDVKCFLSFVALATYAPNKQWALYMRPMVTFDEAERKKWTEATGSMSQTYSTLAEFVPYAREMLTTGGRNLVFGIVCNWTGTPAQFLSAYEQADTQQSRVAFWGQHCSRRAIAVAIFRPANEDRPRLVVFDPSVHYDTARQAMTMLANQWKIDAVEELEKQFGVALQWRGGRLSGALQDMNIRLSDQVELSCGFIWDVASGRLSCSGEELELRGYEQQY